MDPLVTVESTIAVVEAIYEIYLGTQHLGDQPNGFDEVCRDLPRAAAVLRRVDRQLIGLALDGSSTKALHPLAIACEQKAKMLLKIFEMYEKGFNHEPLLGFDRSYSLPRFELADEIKTLIGDFLRGLDELSNLCRHEVQYNEYQKSRTDILRTLYTSPYSDRKNRNPDRVPGTCEWFVGHRDFQQWRESKSSSMLWVSANPGCGKSVLAKYLVDSELETTESRTTCYFFFKDDLEDQRSAQSAVSCILHQLLTRREDLFSEEIVKRLKAYHPVFANSFDELWEVLVSVSQDKKAGELVCILDAFDECRDQERRKLAQALRQFYDVKNEMKDNANLKFLVTSRPYNKIRLDFQRLDTPGLPIFHLKGESDAETSKIAREIDVYIEDRVSRIRKNLRLEQAEEQLLLRELRRVPNQTYLWVYLTLELIESDININKTKIRRATSSLPRTVDNAYEKILSKTENVEEAKKLLHIVVAAARPLTLTEMHLALAIRQGHTCYGDLDLMPEAHFRNYVTVLCGLFVTVKDSKIYLLHNTAKEFLVAKGDPDPRGDHGNRLIWKSSLRPPESHRILCQICIWHLLFTEFASWLMGRYLDGNLGGEVSRYVRDHVFLDYSATNWVAHFRASDIEEDAIIESLRQLCDTGYVRFRNWFEIYCASTQMDCPPILTTLMIASYFGLEQIAKDEVNKESGVINALDDAYQRSALSWASENGFDGIVKLLIEGPDIFSDPRSIDNISRSFPEGAEVDTRDRYGRTPLSYAAWNGQMAVVDRLVKAGARVDSMDEIGGTPVSYALCCGQRAVARRLMGGALVGSVNDIGQELLLSAAEKDHQPVARRLLENGVAIEAVDDDGRTPLSWAAGGGGTRPWLSF